MAAFFRSFVARMSILGAVASVARAERDMESGGPHMKGSGLQSLEAVEKSSRAALETVETAFFAANVTTREPIVELAPIVNTLTTTTVVSNVSSPGNGTAVAGTQTANSTSTTSPTGGSSASTFNQTITSASTFNQTITSGQSMSNGSGILTMADENGDDGVFDCFENEDNWEIGWSKEKRDKCCASMNVGCVDGRVTFNCSSGLDTWVDDWSFVKKDWCCDKEGKGCYANCSSFDCSGDCALRDCPEQNKCRAGNCTSAECCDCETPPPTPPCPTFLPSPCPSPEPTPDPTPSPTPRPTPLPSPVPSPRPTPNPSPCPTLPTPHPTPEPTLPKCPWDHGCAAHAGGICNLEKHCPGNWTCGCRHGYVCLRFCTPDYDNCHTPRQCAIVEPTAVPTPPPTPPLPTPEPPTLEPTPIPTFADATPDPTPRPTPEPTPTPTPWPTTPLCNETHGCQDRSIFGQCYEDCECDGGWRCGCAQGYECVDGCDGDCHTHRVCELSTAVPTPEPTPRPSPVPTQRPTPDPTPETAQPTRKPTLPPSPSPTQHPTTLPPTASPTPFPTFEQCSHDCNQAGGGECIMKVGCPDGWTCSCRRGYVCERDCTEECLHTPRGCRAMPTPAPPPLNLPVVRCSGWSPSSGVNAGQGGSCDFWNQTAKWCFVSEGYDGPGAEYTRSYSLEPSKLWVPCEYRTCDGVSCPALWIPKPSSWALVCETGLCGELPDCCTFVGVSLSEFVSAD
eukprot:TRINITY_DN1860_c0_g2_i3.p1 TRINITY_DN1860_c0_g2~~TRINITY_DN1860_c0_g2_i3.p1  ORF type:complete len:735 (+),score=78.54 TRINITY_DN1860_c0_g2_i3:96-2300(+)